MASLSDGLMNVQKRDSCNCFVGSALTPLLGYFWAGGVDTVRVPASLATLMNGQLALQGLRRYGGTQK
jgi:hypothetical protein